MPQPKNTIPADMILASYRRIEASLAGVLQVVPYCEEHKNVWSDSLIPIILESCGLLDSLWRAQLTQVPGFSEKKRRDLSMSNYFTYFGASLEPKWLVFWAEQPVQLFPFKGWSKDGSYKDKENESYLPWWTAYNKLKHDRLLNRTCATLDIAVKAVSGLFLSVVKCEYCSLAILQSGWLSSRNTRPELYLSEDSVSDKEAYVAVETMIFSYAPSWSNEDVRIENHWLGPASDRFVRWFDLKA